MNPIVARLIVAGNLVALCTSGQAPTFPLEQKNGVATTCAFNYGQEDVTRFLKRNGIQVDAVQSVERNDSGTELFVFFRKPDSNEFAAARVAKDRVVMLASPSQRAFPGSDGKFVAWLASDARSVIFSTGQTLQLPKHGVFSLDASGKYFVLCEKPMRTFLCGVSFSNQLQKISDNLMATDVFAKGDRVVIIGQEYAIQRNGKSGGNGTAVFLEFADKNGVFTLVTRHTIKQASSIVEVAPDLDQLLYWNKFDYSPKLYRYDLRTKKKERLGTAKGFQFFLTGDLLYIGGVAAREN